MVNICHYGDVKMVIMENFSDLKCCPKGRKLSLVKCPLAEYHVNHLLFLLSLKKYVTSYDIYPFLPWFHLVFLNFSPSAKIFLPLCLHLFFCNFINKLYSLQTRNVSLINKADGQSVGLQLSDLSCLWSQVHSLCFNLSLTESCWYLNIFHRYVCLHRVCPCF